MISRHNPILYVSHLKDYHITHKELEVLLLFLISRISELRDVVIRPSVPASAATTSGRPAVALVPATAVLLGHNLFERDDTRKK